MPIQPDVTAKYWEKEEETWWRNSTWYYRKEIVQFCLTCVEISQISKSPTLSPLSILIDGIPMEEI